MRHSLTGKTVLSIKKALRLERFTVNRREAIS